MSELSEHLRTLARRAPEHKVPTWAIDAKDALREAADIIEALETKAEVVRRAVDDAGPRPDVHREIMARHRAEWPTLWDAIDWLIR